MPDTFIEKKCAEFDSKYKFLRDENPEEGIPRFCSEEVKAFLIQALTEQRGEFLNQKANAHDQEVRRGVVKEIVKYIREHATATDGDILFVRFSEKDLSSLAIN